jgi:hypothetical protein
MNNKKFAIWTTVFVGAAAMTYFIVEGIRLKRATKKLIAAEKDLSQYKSIAEDVIKSGDKEEAEIMLASIVEDEKKIKEAKNKKLTTSNRMTTVGNVILQVLPSLLNFLGGVASSPLVIEVDDEKMTVVKEA